MSRRDGKIIDKIRIEGMNIEVPLRLITTDYDGKKFAATYGDETFTGTDVKILTDDLKRYIRSTAKIEWTPIIEISIESNDRFSRDKTYIGLEFDRFLFTRVSEYLKKVDWDYYERGDRGVELLRCSHYWGKIKETKFDKDGIPADEPNSSTYVRPYSDELWNGLNHLKGLIENAGKKLNDLVRSEQGMQKIIAAGSLALLTDGK